MPINFFGKYFKITIVALFFLDLFSLLGYLFTSLNYFFFFAIVFSFLILSLIRPVYGLYIILAELFIGSKGYLFSFEYQGVIISLRVALFLIMMAVWFLYFFKIRKTEWRRGKLAFYYFLIFLALAIGLIKGFLNNEFSNVFFDLNAWFYFALVFPFYDFITKKSQLKNIMQILTAAALFLSFKTIILLYFFSHNFWQVNYSIYRWVRQSGVGEITSLTPNFSRIFIQSQIYVLIFLVVALCLLIFIFKKNQRQYFKFWTRDVFKNKQTLSFIFLSLCSLTAVLISFSRSFWIGLFIAGLPLLAVMIFFLKENIKFISKIIFSFIILFFISVGLIYAVGNFPYPRITDGFSASMLEERATAISGEAGASSRWNLLPKLWLEIKKTPILGAGFGKTVTYQSSDPRIVESTVDALYTTYAFEWGYLDIWLKIGFIGLVIYLLLLLKIWREGWHLFRQYKNNFLGFLLWGLLLGLIVVVGTNIFSPYLNHPLGIGYLILLSVFFHILSKKEEGYPKTTPAG